MATVTKRRNGDGSTSFLVQIRIRPFTPVVKTFQNRADATDWAKQYETTLREQRQTRAVRVDIGSLTFGEIITEFLADPRVKGKKYFDHLEQQLLWWKEQHGTVRALEFNVLRIREARDELLKTRQAGTVNRFLAAARSCLNWARGSGLLPVNSVWPPRLMLPEPKHRERFLTEAELAKLLPVAKAFSPQMFAAVMVAIGTGMRQGELLRLDWKDLDLKKLQVAIHVTKIGEPRRVHLPKSAADALTALKESLTAAPLPSAPVFVTDGGDRLHNYELIGRWQKIRKIAGLSDMRWHDLRHSCASLLVQNGASLPEVGHQLGHRNVATTARYSHLIAGRAVTGADKLDALLRK